MYESTHDRGRLGEERAALFLVEKGFRILERNFRTARGEVDIIAERSGCLCFIEVKSWKTWLRPELGRVLNGSKRMRLRQCAETWIKREEFAFEKCRFDLILVDPQGTAIEHLEGALDR